MAREKIIAQEDNIRLVAMERQCGGTMKLLENYSNLDLNWELESGTVGIWNTLQSYMSYPNLDDFAYLAFLKTSRGF